MTRPPGNSHDAAFWLRAADYDTRFARLLDVHVGDGTVVLLVDANGDDQHVDVVGLRRDENGEWEEDWSDMDVPDTHRLPKTQ